jgi:hypothetical protein
MSQKYSLSSVHSSLTGADNVASCKLSLHTISTSCLLSPASVSPNSGTTPFYRSFGICFQPNLPPCDLWAPSRHSFDVSLLTFTRKVELDVWGHRWQENWPAIPGILEGTAADIRGGTNQDDISHAVQEPYLPPAKLLLRRNPFLRRLT